MSRPHLFRSAASFAAALVAGSAFAQSTPKGLEALPDIPPPPTMSNTPGAADDDAPQITIKQGENGSKIEEFRSRGGKLYAVRVTPSIGKPYVLVDPDSQGGITGATELNGGVRPTQWTLFEF